MSQFTAFLKDAWLELKQVSWLTPPQVVASTGLVVALVIVMAIYVLIVDRTLSHIIGA
jgi:preprotein translocase SecE subunit